ncbi:insulin-like peptide receptor isoform X2 [Zootermopsis nevadensis]|uniref:insulin-like peptide receptor isoform X2 n=1 Tax=Zootermopsis nevadensis TaxID=136037 RepID=UPI000B8E6EFA|nr:insulin-like peptide receptor isoform X2 [Zootermopsis nevadensis]XP_021916148.1 insulin-like peptide receptor isoform X2 [Zootermopsis nevadensis]
MEFPRRHWFPLLKERRASPLLPLVSILQFQEPGTPQELGLRSLTTILRGSVRVEKNRDLCYVNTVDWLSILRKGELFSANNKERSLCPSCPGSCENSGCWSVGVCQNLRNNYSSCHELCLGGCTGPGADQCSACIGVIDDHAVCVDSCPPDRFAFVGRRCVTEEECRNSTVPPPYLQKVPRDGLPSKAWIPFNGTCSLICPQGYQTYIDDIGKQGCEACVGHCRKVCGSGEQIHIVSIYDIQSLDGCTYINGSLEIHVMGSKVLEELQNNFDAIEEISGYLKIYHSYPLVTLNFFKRLRVIHGLKLESDQFALVIVGNDNLQELWNWNSRPRNFSVEKGTLSLHSNPKLCISEIDKLRDIAGLHNNTGDEISYVSNGNKVTCIVIKMNASSLVINSTSVTIYWDPFDVPKERGTLLGYTIHYVETSDNNVALESDSDACGVDNWRVAYVFLNTVQSTADVIMSHNITHLKPFTQYAYYVETYVTPSATEEGRSSIQYFRTDPDRPSIPRYIRAYSNSSSEIILRWQPPLFPNGEISHYIIVCWRHLDDAQLLDQRDYCQVPLEYHKEVEEDRSFLEEFERKEHCCKPLSRETCVSNNDSKFNFIYTQESVNEEQDSCDEQTSMYGILYSPRLYGNGGGIYDSVDLADGHFIQRSEGSATTTILKGLHHFSKYTVKVVACRKDRYGGTDLLWNDGHCSPASLITTRTRKLETADNIDSSFVKVAVESGTVRVFWLEPSDPNGVVVTYHVEYRRTDIVNIKPVVVCVTKQQFEKAKNWFVLSNMAPGKYALRIKATSLAGESKYTNFAKFVVKREIVVPSRRSEMFVLMSIIITSLILLFCLSYLLWKRLKANNFTIVTSANPEYVSLARYEPDEWEIVRDKVELVRELNKGSFGIVYEGILWPANIRCAVKTVDEKATVRERIEFLTEASAMKSFAGGHHVVRLLGVVSRGQPPLVVMELMALGDLKTFLREVRNMTPSPINLSHVLLMAAQIADGMAYLEASKFVHRDLAARNCMLTENGTVKIGDFGMARDIYETDYYRKGNKGLLPVRWMAPESLADGIFTNQSDVWSYGVVLWEISTLAEQPYQGLANEQVLQFVLRGELLDKPDCCPDILYSLMLACWQKRPVNRPSFLRLVSIIDAVTEVGDEFRQTSFYHSQTGQELREAHGETRARSSSSEEDSFEDMICLQSCGACERLDFPLLNSEFNSDVPEGSTSSGLNFNMEILSHNSHSSTDEPHYLNMSTQSTRPAADDYVVGDFGS